MKIGIIGGNGKTGAKIYAEAMSRGHQATAIVRSAQKAQAVLGEDANTLEKDAFDLTRDDLTAFDVVVDAFGLPQGFPKPYLHLDLVTQLVARLRESSTRLVVIIGAASLKMPDGRKLIDHLLAMPAHESWVGTPLNQTHELDFLQMIDNVSWVAASPSREFVPGDATGYVLGTDSVLFDADGRSHLTTGNMAVAILDEIESPEHEHGRFTARDKEV